MPRAQIPATSAAQLSPWLWGASGASLCAKGRSHSVSERCHADRGCTHTALPDRWHRPVGLASLISAADWVSTSLHAAGDSPFVTIVVPFVSTHFCRHRCCPTRTHLKASFQHSSAKTRWDHHRPPTPLPCWEAFLWNTPCLSACWHLGSSFQNYYPCPHAHTLLLMLLSITWPFEIQKYQGVS